MVMLGAFLSTLFPPMGPAVVQLPALSQTVRVPVEALVVSVSTATFVESEKERSEALTKPETLSLAAQVIFTSPECHNPSAGSQETEGAVLSRLTVKACVASTFPALSVAK